MVVILLKCLLQKKRKVNRNLRKESRNMRLSIECKTLFVSAWDAVMKLTAVGSDIGNFKNFKPPPNAFLRTSACVCRTSENCKSLVLQGECNIEIFLSPARDKVYLKRFDSTYMSIVSLCCYNAFCYGYTSLPVPIQPRLFGSTNVHSTLRSLSREMFSRRGSTVGPGSIGMKPKISCLPMPKSRWSLHP